MLTAPEMGRWTFAVALSPDEIEKLKGGDRVTKTYPEPLPGGPPPLLPEDLEALRSGKSVTKMGASMPPPHLGPGDVVSVTSSEGPHRQPPALSPEEFEALRAGKTLTRTRPPEPPPPRGPLALRVKVVEYRHEGNNHVYTFEPM